MTDERQTTLDGCLRFGESVDRGLKDIMVTSIAELKRDEIAVILIPTYHRAFCEMLRCTLAILDSRVLRRPAGAGLPPHELDTLIAEIRSINIDDFFNHAEGALARYSELTPAARLGIAASMSVWTGAGLTTLDELANNLENEEDMLATLTGGLVIGGIMAAANAIRGAVINGLEVLQTIKQEYIKDREQTPPTPANQ